MMASSSPIAQRVREAEGARAYKSTVGGHGGMPCTDLAVDIARHCLAFRLSRLEQMECFLTQAFSGPDSVVDCSFINAVVSANAADIQDAYHEYSQSGCPAATLLSALTAVGGCGNQLILD